MKPPNTPLRPPSTADTLARIEAKLDRLERALGPLSVLAEAPAMAGTALEAIDDVARGQEANFDARMRGAVEVLERISRPQTLAMLNRVVDIAESVPGLVATAVDSIDDVADPDATDIHGRIEAGVALLGRLTHPDTLKTVTGLLDQVTNPAPVETGIPVLDAYASDGMSMEQLAREGLQLIGQVVVFMRHAQANGERKVGVLGLLKALRDPNTQRAMGFAMSFLEGFGQALEGSAPPKQLRS